MLKYFVILAFAALILMSASTPSIADTYYGNSDAYDLNFYIIVDQSAIEDEQWNDIEPPENVLMNAYKYVSAYKAGLPFHYEENRDSLQITWQIEGFSDTLDYIGYEPVDNCYRFDFSFPVAPHNGDDQESFQGHGVDGDQNIAYARAWALDDALGDAVRAAIIEKYMESDEDIWGAVDGRIVWFDIIQEMRDPDSGNYVVDVNAWIVFDE